MGNNHTISTREHQFIRDREACCPQLNFRNPNDQIRKKLQKLMMITVVLPDGTVDEIQGTSKPVTAADAAASGKRCKIDDAESATCTTTTTWLVCNSKSLHVGKRPCPLQPDARLRPGSLYFVLPARAFQSRLTWSHLAILIRRAAPAIRRSQPAAAPSWHVSAGHITSNILRRMCIKRQIVPAPTPEISFNSCGVDEVLSHSNIDEYDSEVLSHFVDHLIQRSNSWRPGLDSVQEES